MGSVSGYFPKLLVPTTVAANEVSAGYLRYLSLVMVQVCHLVLADQRAKVWVGVSEEFFGPDPKHA